jgi:flagellar assembly protein FliH
MSDMIPKESLTAYQRWELPTFDPPKEELVEIPTATLPTAAEVEQMHQQAYDEGHQEGYDRGYAEGAKQAREEEQKARDEVLRLGGMIDALDKELQQVDQQVAQSLLDLSMELAKRMLLQALKVKPELLLNVVNEAISELPHFSHHAYLILHPADAELVRSRMGEQLDHTGWKILEDAKIECGGCRVETANSQIDATLATRWKRIVASIGQESAWLEP